MRLARERRENRGDAPAHQRCDGLRIQPYDEAVNDSQFDTGTFFEFLREDDNANERIAGMDVNLLKLVGEFKDIGDSNTFADQRRFDLVACWCKFLELALDIKPEQFEAEFLGLRRHLRARWHLRNGDAAAPRRWRNDRRCDLARRRHGLRPGRSAQNEPRRHRHAEPYKLP